jgi:hypothetical protein
MAVQLRQQITTGAAGQRVFLSAQDELSEAKPIIKRKR